jgi:hypothetical protein
MKDRRTESLRRTGVLAKLFAEDRLLPSLRLLPQTSLVWAMQTFFVEVRGFEPLTPAVRRQCSTGLSYTPGTGPA